MGAGVVVQGVKLPPMTPTPIWVPVHALAALLSIQLLADAPGKPAEGGPGV